MVSYQTDDFELSSLGFVEEVALLEKGDQGCPLLVLHFQRPDVLLHAADARVQLGEEVARLVPVLDARSEHFYLRDLDL